MEQNNPDNGIQVTEDATESLFITEDQAKAMEQVNDLDRIGDILGNWHNKTINTFNHVLDMPINEDPENPVNGILVLDPTHAEANEDGLRPLTEAERIGFMFGIRYSMEIISDFPLKFMPLDADGNVTAEYASEVQEDNSGGDNAPTENQS